MRIARIVDGVGGALVLQLTFVVFALPLITITPAAVALQRSLDDHRSGFKTGVIPYSKSFKEAWSQYWQAGVGFTLLGAAVAVGLPFWFSVTSAVGVVGLGLLVCMTGFITALYLCLLWSSNRERSLRGRAAVRAAFHLLVRRPLFAGIGVLLFGTWVVLMLAIPSLALVGSGLVPALIARYTLTPRAEIEAGRDRPSSGESHNSQGRKGKRS